MFSRCSVGVVPHVDVFVGRKVISLSYSSAILKVLPLLSYFKYYVFTYFRNLLGILVDKDLGL